ncbi:hypothetical protein [Micropruina sp.]|uniref:hypothetical protein n=1 Tax=Micropruina sp. TaxID=2737536 RepID=UPI0039E65A99
MSALHTKIRTSDAGSRPFALSDVRAGLVADPAATVAVLVALWMLVFVSAAITVVGVTAQSSLQLIGGGLASVVLLGALVWLAPALAERDRH